MNLENEHVSLQTENKEPKVHKLDEGNKMGEDKDKPVKRKMVKKEDDKKADRSMKNQSEHPQTHGTHSCYVDPSPATIRISSYFCRPWPLDHRHYM